VQWVVRQLAAALSARLVLEGTNPLSDLLASAIKDTCDAHASTCDLDNPDSPSSTVSIVRVRDDRLDFLTLGDSPIVLWRKEETFTLLADYRTARLPGGRPYSVELVRAHRNKPGGFWVASTDSNAAYEAIQGTVGLDTVAEAGLFTDGVTRLVEWYGRSWPEILTRQRRYGPASLIALVREAERASPHAYAKQHDDATAVHIVM